MPVGRDDPTDRLGAERFKLRDVKRRFDRDGSFWRRSQVRSLNRRRRNGIRVSSLTRR